MCEDSDDECRGKKESPAELAVQGVPEADLVVYVSIITDRNKCRTFSTTKHLVFMHKNVISLDNLRFSCLCKHACLHLLPQK